MYIAKGTSEERLLTAKREESECGNKLEVSNPDFRKVVELEEVK
jgi:hypothetical protein